MSSACLRNESSTGLEVRPALPAWIVPLIGGGLFAYFGVMLIWVGQQTLLFGIFCLSLAAFFVAANPLHIKLTLDLQAQQLRFTALYLLRWPQRLEIEVPFSQITKMGFRPVRWGKPQAVDVVLADGVRLVLMFGSGRAKQAERLLSQFTTQAAPEALAQMNAPEVVKQAEAAETRSQMLRGLRSWSVWLLIMGGAQMVSARGFSAWGALLIGVGLASFFFQEAPMFMVYAVTVAWAGLSNLLYGDGLWKGFALIQAVLAFQIFMQFRRFRQAERTLGAQTGAEADGSRVARLFPWVALGLGLGGLVGLGAALGGIWVNVLLIHSRTLLTVLGLLETTAIFAGLLGLATGLAGWVGAYPRKAAYIAGCVTGGLTLLGELGLALLLTLK